MLKLIKLCKNGMAAIDEWETYEDVEIELKNLRIVFKFKIEYDKLILSCDVYAGVGPKKNIRMNGARVFDCSKSIELDDLYSVAQIIKKTIKYI